MAVNFARHDHALVRQILIPALHVASFDAGHVTAQPRQLSCTGMLQALSEYDAAVPRSDAASEYDPAVPGSDAAKLPNKTSPMTIAEYDTVRISPPKEMLHRKASTRATPTSENAGRPSFRDVTARDHEGWRVESPGCLYRAAYSSLSTPKGDRRCRHLRRRN